MLFEVEPLFFIRCMWERVFFVFCCQTKNPSFAFFCSAQWTKTNPPGLAIFKDTIWRQKLGSWMPDRILPWMPKCYRFPFDALKSMKKNQDPLPVQCGGSTACLLDGRYAWPQLPPSRDDDPQLGSRNQLDSSHPISWGARVTGALGWQQVCPDTNVLPKKQSWSPFLWEKVKEDMTVGSLSHGAAVTGVSLGAVSGTRMSTLTRATATTAFPGAVVEGFVFSL